MIFDIPCCTVATSSASFVGTFTRCKAGAVSNSAIGRN